MVTAPAELIDPTGHRGSVHAPRPPRYANSSWGFAPPGLRQLPIVVAPPEYPVEFCPVSEAGSAPCARSARDPLTYTCRVFVPAGAWATQIGLPALIGAQPVTCTEPASTGRAPV